MASMLAVHWIATILVGVAVAEKSKPGCFGANTSSFPWCSGYAELGYNCSQSGELCASATCLKTCMFCTIEYQNAVLDEVSGQCCDSIVDGECKGAKLGVVTNKPYGLPDHKPATIFEGTVPYHNGPPVWSKQNPAGSYGFTFNAGAENDGECPPLPLVFNATNLKTASLKASGSGATGCFIACNLTEVEETGVDPCEAGSVNSPTAGPAAMRCYSGGDTWLKPPHTGMCAFNCTLRVASTGAATCESPTDPDCELACNTLDWYNPNRLH